MTPSRSEFIAVRGLRLHVRHWGRVGAPQLFMLHGWMDISASFQFVVDALQGDWHVIAPDWRGFGLSEQTSADTYWFPDYLGDLDAILQYYAPQQAVNLLGHSMGANVAAMYAGVRPERIAKLINLEGFGLLATQPEQAPERYVRWLEQLREPIVMRGYPSRQAVAARLQKNNVRLSDVRADFLSQYWAAPDAAGQWQILGDPVHKHTNPALYQIEEVMACWRAVSAPVLWIEARDTEIWKMLGPIEVARSELSRRLACFAHLTSHMVEDAGHMVHHDQPEILAGMIEAFL